MDDFERRRELRRQKREEMRQEAERATYQRNDDDEEEAARERRRRARQERQRLNKDDGEGHDGTQNSITGEETKSSSIPSTDLSADDEAALLERLAKREERRQKRLKEALERQKELDPTISITLNETTSFSKSSRNGENEVQENDTSPKENDTETYTGRHEVEETETVDKSFERNNTNEEEEEVENVETEEVEVKQEVQDEAPEEPHIEENEIKEEKPKGGKEELKASWERKTKAQNGESLHEATPQKLKHMDKFGGAKGQPSSDETDAGTKVEAGKKLDELKRRRGDTETGEFEKLKQKQQQSAAELEDLKKKREERRKIMEEEEQRKKQEEAERKAKEEEEKKKQKEERERRRAEAAEKRQKVPEEGLSEEKKPFKCFTPKGSAFKIEERAEFLNRSSQKSVKSSQPAMVSKIDSRLEQYTSAIGNNKGAKPIKGAPADLPLATVGVRNVKSMWETGNVFSSPGGVVSPNKETAGLKVGVSSRINEWLTKTPETNKTPSAKPLDLRPGDVSGKRNIWEKQQTEKPGSPTKMTTGGKKSDTNGLRFEKEP
ncbi:caldesmon isoform X4 [Dendropsophus ebraccatus]|uniref:caldesmon isoform X4 n=1 Tax=Dendropsophus ebraccatus TaxID=150705 RepID=UPI00383140BE